MLNPLILEITYPLSACITVAEPTDTSICCFALFLCKGPFRVGTLRRGSVRFLRFCANLHPVSDQGRHWIDHKRSTPPNPGRLTPHIVYYFWGPLRMTNCL